MNSSKKFNLQENIKFKTNFESGKYNIYFRILKITIKNCFVNVDLIQLFSNFFSRKKHLLS